MPRTLPPPRRNRSRRVEARGAVRGQEDAAATANETPESKSHPKGRPGPVGGARDLNRRARTEALLTAAEALFLAHGVDGASIDDITQRAAIAKGSFYRYFDDKTDLVARLLAPLATELLGALSRAAHDLAQAATGEDTRPVFLRLGRTLFVALMGRPSLSRLLLQESHAAPSPARAPLHALAREVSLAAERITELALVHGLARRAPPQVSALLVIGAVERLLLAHFAGDLKSTPPEAIQGVVALVLDGMRERN